MKADGERRLANLLRKQVFLVEKQNDAGVFEPLIVADGVEELHRFHHSILNIEHRKERLKTIFSSQL